MVALHVCHHGLVNFGVQTPEIHAPQNLKNDMRE